MACFWGNSAYPPRGTMNAVGNSGFRSIDHAQKQSVYYLNDLESMNGTTYHLIPTVYHHLQLLDMPFFMIYLIYNYACLNFNYFMQVFTVLLTIDFAMLFYMD